MIIVATRLTSGHTFEYMAEAAFIRRVEPVELAHVAGLYEHNTGIGKEGRRQNEPTVTPGLVEVKIDGLGVIPVARLSRHTPRRDHLDGGMAVGFRSDSPRTLNVDVAINMLIQCGNGGYAVGKKDKE